MDLRPIVEKKLDIGFTDAELDNSGAGRRELGACTSASLKGRKNASLKFAIRAASFLFDAAHSDDLFSYFFSQEIDYITETLDRHNELTES